MTIATIVVLAVLALVVVGGLYALQRRWGLDTMTQAAGESASRLVPTPVRTRASLRRRFARALIAQRVLMPSGQVVAATHLHVRVAPEDVERLAPDGDLQALALDGAVLYQRHAQREGWQLLLAPEVTIGIDPVLRSGWIPLARVHRADPADVDARAVAPRPEPTGALAPTDPAPSATGVAATDVHPLAVRTSEAAPVEVEQGTRRVQVPAAVESPDATVLTRARTAALVLTGPDGTALRFGTDGGTVGRTPECTVLLDDPSVSRRHARVDMRDGAWWITDLGSSNGTFVNGERLPHRDARRLQPGDQVRLHADGDLLTVRVPPVAV